MTAVLVHVHVKDDQVDAFKAASIENARQSVLEPGIARFDVIQQVDDRTRFLLVEVYRSADAMVAHKATGHYATWRDTVAEMMASPRTSAKYEVQWPGPEGWR